MAEYIDRDAAIETVKFYDGDPDGIPLAIRSLKVIPAADVRPVVRGKWTRINVNVSDNLLWVKWECSKCGHLRTEGWEHTGEGKKPIANFCEICGAYMRGVTDDA